MCHFCSSSVCSHHHRQSTVQVLSRRLDWQRGTGGEPHLHSGCFHCFVRHTDSGDQRKLPHYHTHLVATGTSSKRGGQRLNQQWRAQLEPHLQGTQREEEAKDSLHASDGDCSVLDLHAPVSGYHSRFAFCWVPTHRWLHPAQQHRFCAGYLLHGLQSFHLQFF